MQSMLFKNSTARSIVFGLFLASVAGTIALTALVQYHPISGLDVSISQEVQEERGFGLLFVMEAVSVFGIPWVAICTTLVVAGAFFAASLRREGLFTLLTLGTGAVNAIVKAVFNRPRPTDTLITVYQKLSDPSFPSGHVVYYVVFFGFLIAAMALAPRIPKALRIAVSTASVALIVLVSISRLYLGVHWATDVVGGYCIGLALLAGLLHYYFKRAGTER
jgi:undecaprenyl-diphosphatase